MRSALTDAAESVLGLEERMNPDWFNESSESLEPGKPAVFKLPDVKAIAEVCQCSDMCKGRRGLVPTSSEEGRWHSMYNHYSTASEVKARLSSILNIHSPYSLQEVKQRSSRPHMAELPTMEELTLQWVR